MEPFPGFPSNSRFTPVPDALLGPLLEGMDDLAELKVVLRVLFLLHQKKGFPRAVSQAEVEQDPALRKAFEAEGDARAVVRRSLDAATRRGVLLRAQAGASQESGGTTVYLLNNESNVRALGRLDRLTLSPAPLPEMDAAPTTRERNIFTLYEDNIGALTPLVAEELKEAEATYPMEWVEDAFREAASLNKRSWRYVARILERWQQEGRGRGEPGRHPAKNDPKEYLRGWGRPNTRRE